MHNSNATCISFFSSFSNYTFFCDCTPSSGCTWHRTTQLVLCLRMQPMFLGTESNLQPPALSPSCAVCPAVGDLSTELVRHFLIECTQKGVRLKGCPNEPYFGENPSISFSISLSLHPSNPLSPSPSLSISLYLSPYPSLSISLHLSPSLSTSHLSLSLNSSHLSHHLSSSTSLSSFSHLSPSIHLSSYFIPFLSLHPSLHLSLFPSTPSLIPPFPYPSLSTSLPLPSPLNEEHGHFHTHICVSLRCFYSPVIKQRESTESNIQLGDTAVV